MDRRLLVTLFLFLFVSSAFAKDNRLWIKAQANNVKQRSQLANSGLSIEIVASDYVIGIATPEEAKQIEKLGLLLEKKSLDEVRLRDFPPQDEKFHNYTELTNWAKDLAAKNPNLVQLDSIGKSVEGRELWHLRIGTDFSQLDAKPGIVFMGGHHAREHVSIEMPIKLADRLISEYNAGNTDVKKLIDNRDIHIIPMVNPDGAEYDIGTGAYMYWRKNRDAAGRSVGIDLNRNYGFGWGGEGSSDSPYSEIYRGPSAFSEPETQSIKRFIDKQSNLTTLLSFHTFSELILFPWGHTDEKIPDDTDYRVHKKMAETMAQWNGYTPEQSSDLYLASGDTTDWSYGVHKIISFTFELDPKDMFSGGFYPGQDEIDVVFNKNLKPCLYLMEYADNPRRVLEPTHVQYGLSTPLLQ